MQRFLSYLIAIIIFLTMIFPNLNHLLAESSNTSAHSEAVTTELTEF